MKERCVCCGAETEYDLCTPVEQRYRYIEGAGQLCTRCYRETYEIPASDPDSYVSPTKRRFGVRYAKQDQTNKEIPRADADAVCPEIK